MDFLRGGKEFELKDSVSSSIREGKIPTLEDIADDMGNDKDIALEPILFSVASTRLTYPRKNGDDPALHYVDQMLRQYVWKLGYGSTRDCFVFNATHDQGEDNSLERLAGALAVNRAVSRIFGSDEDHSIEYFIGINALTHLRGIVLKQVLKNLPTTGIDSRRATDEDLYTSFKKVKSGLLTKHRKDQERSLLYLKDKIELFGLNVQDIGLEALGALRANHLNPLERELYLEMVHAWLQKIESSLKSPMTLKEIKKYAIPIIDSIEAIRQDTNALQLDDNCTYPIGMGRRPIQKERDSPTIHAAKKAVYKAYGEGIGQFVVDYAGKLSYRSIDVSTAKMKDKGDNIRVPAGSGMELQHDEYSKTQMFISVAPEWIKGYQARVPDDKIGIYNARKELDTLKGQYAIRVIADASQMSHNPDTRSDYHMAWLLEEVRKMEQNVGENFMQQFRKNLQNQPNLLALRKGHAERISKGYDEVKSMYANQEVNTKNSIPSPFFQRLSRAIASIGSL